MVAPLAVAAAAFFGVRYLLDVMASSPQLLQEEHPEIAIDAAKPRFDGELLGIYLGPPEVLAAKGIQTNLRTVCPGGLDVVPGGGYAPPAPKYLPPGAREPAEYEAALDTAPNPGATICRDNGQLYTAWRLYELPGAAAGAEGQILINRVREPRPSRETDAPPDRVQVVSVGGRSAIVVKPVVAEGGTVATVTNVIFPEPGGYTVIQAEVVSFDEVMKVAESLAPALQ
ncbi:MAG: hypothetical protein HYS09_06465 [Chloroflexi bacterium]|nr:hypothetical protein [Chloroflexota bacterium]